MSKKIGILTSGGDAPGMNAAIRAFVREGISLGYEILGIEYGYAGLLENKIKLLSSRDVGLIISQGGTFLKTSRSEEFKTENGQKKAAETLHKAGINALCVIGGEGSFQGLKALSQYFKGCLVGIPGTIDNDIPGTEYTIGFNTAVETAVNAVDKIRDTALSHGRIFFVEVMGRRSGNIATATALACGAEDVLIPEIKTNIEELCQRLVHSQQKGKLFSVVIVSEGDDAGGAFKIGEIVKEKTGLPERVTILGHLQRGGTPSVYDRIMASKMGIKAVEFIKNDMNLVFTSFKKGEVVPEPIGSTQQLSNVNAKSRVEMVRVLAG